MATALELGRQGWAQYAPGARRRLQETREAAVVPDQDRLTAALRQAADVLRRDFGAARIVLFGSLARGERYPGSDIDIAVEGLTGDYWQAWRVVEEAVPGCSVDLVELESASPSLRAAIAREGVEL